MLIDSSATSRGPRCCSLVLAWPGAAATPAATPPTTPAATPAATPQGHREHRVGESGPGPSARRPSQAPRSRWCRRPAGATTRRTGDLPWPATARWRRTMQQFDSGFAADVSQAAEGSRSRTASAGRPGRHDRVRQARGRQRAVAGGQGRVVPTRCRRARTWSASRRSRPSGSPPSQSASRAVVGDRDRVGDPALEAVGRGVEHRGRAPLRLRPTMVGTRRRRG